MRRPEKEAAFSWKLTCVGLCFAVVINVTVARGESKMQFGKPDVLIVSGDLKGERRQSLIDAAQQFYTFWNTGDPALLSRVISPSFTDRALPPGRPQGPDGPLFAFRQFTKAVPDLRCEVLQQIIVQDRVVSHLRFTGHFSGAFGSLHGHGQDVDFIATDIIRIDAHGQITDNWHIEDNLTFLKQIGAVPQ